MSLVRQRGSANAIPSPPAGRAMAYAAFAALACAIVVASLIAAPGWTGAFGAGLGLLMAAIAVIDGRSFAIPNKLTLAAFALGLANAANETFESIPENILHAAVRGILLALAFYLFRAIYFQVRHRHGLGLGDAKLAAAAGVWLDWALIPTAIEVAALAALAVYAVSRLLQRRPFNPAAKLPFGLFFAPAIWVSWLVEAISLKP